MSVLLRQRFSNEFSMLNISDLIVCLADRHLDFLAIITDKASDGQQTQIQAENMETYGRH